jgi:AAHS family benzoate transporter-like MFS transporter
MSTNYLSAASVRTKNPAGVIATCGLMIMFDGYDLVV